MDVDSNTYYWGQRLIGALADANYGTSIMFVERMQAQVFNRGRAILNEYDEKFNNTNDIKLLEEANEKQAKMAFEETQNCLNKVLHDASIHMKNGYNRSDN